MCICPNVPRTCLLSLDFTVTCRGAFCLHFPGVRLISHPPFCLLSFASVLQKNLHLLLFWEYFHRLDFTVRACKKIFLSPPGSPGRADVPGEFSARVRIGQLGSHVEPALSAAAAQIFHVSLGRPGSRCANWELPMQTSLSCTRGPSPAPG